MTHLPTMRRRIVGALLASGVAVSLAACSSDDDSSSSDDTSAATESASGSASESASESQGEWPRTVDSIAVDNGSPTDKTEEVEIPAKPEKIVSTSVTLTGSLLSIDAPVIASGAASPGPTSDDKGFFKQWADVADERGVKEIGQLEPDFEKIAAEDPDLIIVSSAGADTAVDLVDRLKEVAPTVVLDYSDKDWTEVTTQLGEITGHESEAEDTIQEFKDRASEVTENIEEPEQPVQFILPAQDGGVNFMTGESAQGRIITELGWDLDVPGKDVVRTDGDYAGRTDVVQVTDENLDKGLTGKTVFATNADADNPVSEQLKEKPTARDTYAVKNDRIFEFGAETFRIDFYSAMLMLDQIEEYFKK
ncbi:MAG: Fe2+-enterobactin ABC transporter substrate-binding protein [Corynebacterium sp.]|jgi:iron complex transport system substrate-binding protein|uniref:Fe2+-enterobactin ABC transporter substrate-binding protein n=1 Tax=unclassified Corynebacterium TaxID=2624378 RepID=UPI0009596D26|nr:Fe2+-enterobactin ABC transporter substrate-binding protein [Corynebacterium sp. CNJ-954]OLT53709.1 sialic acid synthase [Corynebacterium sp. CNJ-954]